jgi:hypothetical protein
VARTRWEPNKKEIILFEFVKAYFLDPKTLIYCNLVRQLYLKINALNKRGFGILAFYLKQGYIISSNFNKIVLIAI